MQTMNNRYRLIHRQHRGGMFYCVDKTTRKRTSLKTTDEAEAHQLVFKNHFEVVDFCLQPRSKRTFLDRDFLTSDSPGWGMDKFHDCGTFFKLT
jgi:hypothetical protein